MGVSKQKSVVPRIEIPPFHTPCVNALAYGGILFFVALAAFYWSRFHFTSSWLTLFAAVAWLLIVFSSIGLSIHDDGGVRPWCLNRINDVSRRRFVEAEAQSGEPLEIRIGCRLLAWRFYVVEIPGKAITSVDWNTGQATGLAGKDMNDWHITIWYHQPARSKAKLYAWSREEQLYIATGMASKCKVEPFGHSLVAFLQDAGVMLKPTENLTEFTLTGKSIRDEMDRRCRLWMDKQRQNVEGGMNGQSDM